MSAVNKKLISRVVTLIVIAVFGWYFFANIHDFKKLLDINPIFILLLIIINVTGIVANGIFMKWSIALFGKNIKIHESVRVSLISTAGNFFAPAGSGLGFRAVYLKKKHNLAYSDYISIVFCSYILAFLVNATLGLYALYELRHGNSASVKILEVVFAGLLTASLAAIFIRVKSAKAEQLKSQILKRIYQVFCRITDGWQLILSNRKIMVGLFCLMVVNTALMILDAYFVMSSINIHVPLAGLFLFSAMGSLSVFVNITPGNLGVKEAIYIVFSTIIGLTTAQVLSVAIIDRSALFLVLFVLWTIYGRKVSITNNSEVISIVKAS